MPIPSTDVPAIAAQLDAGTLHVWRLRYDRRQGRAPLLHLLGGYLGVPADAIRLEPGPHGRPRLDPAHGDALDFNWSHSGDCALVALGRQLAPGVDVERRHLRPRALELAQRYFHPAEAARLAALPVDRREQAFLALWTAKEAVLKALGRGLAFGLHRLQIDLSTGAPQLLQLEGEHADAWQLHALDAGPEHVATLAWRGPPCRIEHRVLADAG